MSNPVQFEVGKHYTIPKAAQFDIVVISVSETRKSMMIQVSGSEPYKVRIHTSTETGIYHESCAPLSRFGSKLAMRAHWEAK